MSHLPYRARVLRRPPSTVVITARQAECLDGLADGLSNAQIGARLGCTEDTTKGHMKGLLRRLGADNRAHAVGLVLTGRVTVLVNDPRMERAA